MVHAVVIDQAGYLDPAIGQVLDETGVAHIAVDHRGTAQ